jgi:hypothetical protein
MIVATIEENLLDKIINNKKNFVTPIAQSFK